MESTTLVEIIFDRVGLFEYHKIWFSDIYSLLVDPLNNKHTNKI